MWYIRERLFFKKKSRIQFKGRRIELRPFVCRLRVTVGFAPFAEAACCLKVEDYFTQFAVTGKTIGVLTQSISPSNKGFSNASYARKFS